MRNYRFFSRLILVTSLLLLDVGCNGLLKELSLDKLATDAAGMPKGDLAGPGLQQVDATRVEVLN
ncbi:MAG: hypothetical protein WAV82_08230, partial [Methylobacter sp.]